MKSSGDSSDRDLGPDSDGPQFLLEHLCVHRSPFNTCRWLLPHLLLGAVCRPLSTIALSNPNRVKRKEAVFGGTGAAVYSRSFQSSESCFADSERLAQTSQTAVFVVQNASFSTISSSKFRFPREANTNVDKLNTNHSKVTTKHQCRSKKWQSLKAQFNTRDLST